MPLSVLPFLFLALARAETIDARVTHIGDGDSLSVCIARQETRVRLVYIDAPEYRQPFGREARRSLAELCADKVARLDWTQKDRYGRLLARVSCDSIDVNTEQVRRGMAWVSSLDKPEPAFYAAQRSARASRLGLWSDPDPVPPWKWRRAHRPPADSKARFEGTVPRECSQ
ncbi:MAG TPA: thermonuclease family protein [Burkholderiales bacterium]|nr:thermonuclease family protein [Burkholderiales bacterium]